MKDLIKSIVLTALLVYFMSKSESQKVIFLPFLFCSIAMLGKSIGLILGKEPIAVFFDKVFKGSFLLFWFGFLLAAGYIGVRDQRYGMLLFSLPFWGIGLHLVKTKLLGSKMKNTDGANLNFAMIVSGGLVSIAVLSGLVLLIWGFIQFNLTIIFAGVFFTFVGGVFVIAGLTAAGCFANAKVDVLGLYMGIVLILVGLGVPAVKYAETLSLINTVQEFGAWLLVPVLLIAAGILQVIRVLKNSI